jgi:glycosyltransferase involved in cell wall biosynthesis
MAKRTKVLSLTSKLYFGGHEHRLLSLAQHIDRGRFEHCVATLTRDPEDARDQGAMRPQFAAAGIPVEDLGMPQETVGKGGGAAVCRSAFGVGRGISRLAAYLRRRKIEVVEAHHTTAMFVSVLAAKLAGVRSIVTAYHTRSWERAWMQWPGKLTLRWADAVVTDSRARGDEIAAWSGLPPSKITVIPNGIEPPGAARPSPEVRAALGLPADPSIKVIGQVSGMVPSKGHDVLLEAAARILRRNPRVAFLFVGYARGHEEYVRQLRQRVEQLGLAGRVCIGGYPGPIGDVWNVIDLHVHASRFDSLPNAIIEGMSLGKPAVVTSVGGIPEVVTHGETGLIVPPGDIDGLEGAILRLLDSPAEAARLGAGARRRYEERLRPERMTADMEQLFARLAG